MEKKNVKRNTPEINEELMMNMMVDGVQKDGLKSLVELPVESTEAQKPVTREKQKVRKTNEQDYELIFFKRVETNARDGKTVYLRPDFHEKLSRIVQVIGEDKLSIYAYLDNLLAYHFEEFGDQITKSFNDKYKPIL